MKLLIFGSNGQLGLEFRKKLENNAEYINHKDLDITNENAVKNFFAKKNKFDFVINCAAYTAVDKAESDVELATAVNIYGARNLAKYSKRIIHFSTDYVFGDEKCRPYIETDRTSPKSIYGYTKLMGENEVLENSDTAVIIRTSWLYSIYGNNFVNKIYKLSMSKNHLDVVYDQIGTPTYAKDLVDVVYNILPKIENFSKEIYHFSNEGVCSWYDFASRIINLMHLKCKINPIETVEESLKAKRPFYSVLNKTKIKNKFNISIPHWEDSLYRCLKQF